MVRKSHNSYFEMTVESVFRHCYDSRFPTKMYNLTAVFAMRNPIGQKNVLYRIPISQFKVYVVCAMISVSLLYIAFCYKFTLKDSLP